MEGGMFEREWESQEKHFWTRGKEDMFSEIKELKSRNDTQLLYSLGHTGRDYIHI